MMKGNGDMIPRGGAQGVRHIVQKFPVHTSIHVDIRPTPDELVPHHAIRIQIFREREYTLLMKFGSAPEMSMSSTMSTRPLRDA